MAPLPPEQRAELEAYEREIGIGPPLPPNDPFYRQGPTIVFNPPWRRTSGGAEPSPTTSTSGEEDSTEQTPEP